MYKHADEHSTDSEREDAFIEEVQQWRPKPLGNIEEFLHEWQVRNFRCKMKHFVLSSAWKYNPLALAYKIDFGERNSESDFLPLVDIKPTRQLIVSDDRGQFQLGAKDCSGDTVRSVIALPQDEFGYIQDRVTGRLTLIKSRANRSEECLLFAGCCDCDAINKQKSSGVVFCEYRRSVDCCVMLEFVAHLRQDEAIVLDGLEHSYVEYAWDGRKLTRREFQ